MDTKGRLIAGSHNRNEFVLINADEIGRVTSVKELTAQICQICGDEIEFTKNGEPFVACNECAFPVCRPCYETKEGKGNQACPQCKTRYKRIKGSPRVDGDEDEEEFDDLDKEFDHNGIGDGIRPSRHHLNRSISGIANQSELDPSVNSEIPLLTYGQEDDTISADKHALIIPRAHYPAVYEWWEANPSREMTVPSRPMDPKKDLALYSYGTVAWKERME